MVKKLISVQFGNLIRKYRIRQNLSQEDFADLCGLHRTYVGSIERGEKTVTIDTTYKLTKALNISLGALFLELDTLLENSLDDK